MSRVLYAWELGAGYGHVSAALPLALELRQRGHEVVFAVRDLPRASAFLGRHGFRVHQAPIWLHDSSGLPPAVNYSELLFRVGFLDDHGLMGLARGWRDLFRLIEPNLLLADHAPTALLAARGVPFKRAIFGTGFCSPPRSEPLPSFRPWVSLPPERLAESDRRVLEVANRVADRLGGEPLGAVADLFSADEDFLCTFPELDPYSGRGSVRYWGPAFAGDEGAAPEWPPGRGARIFAYLYHEFETALRSVADLPHRLLVHAAGADVSALRSRYRHVGFSQGPVQMARVVEECDLVLCHAGHGTVTLALLAGRPLFLLPFQIEQTLTSRNVVRYGAGTMVNPDSRTPPYRRLVGETLRDPAYAERAREFSRGHSDFSPDGQCRALVARCEELLS